MMLKTDAVIDAHTVKVAMVADSFPSIFRSYSMRRPTDQSTSCTSCHHLSIYSHAPKVESVRIFYIVQLHLQTDDS